MSMSSLPVAGLDNLTLRSAKLHSWVCSTSNRVLVVMCA